jgi:hypothetical protein
MQRSRSRAAPARGASRRAGQRQLRSIEPLFRSAREMRITAIRSTATLPAANRSKPWREVLGVDGAITGLGPNAARAIIENAYRELAVIHHPDRGGSHERMTEVNRARDEALKELSR